MALEPLRTTLSTASTPRIEPASVGSTAPSRAPSLQTGAGQAPDGYESLIASTKTPVDYRAMMERRDPAELAAAYERGKVTPIPTGFGQGTAIFFPSQRPWVRRISKALDGLVRWVWQGKTIRNDGKTLDNRLFSRFNAADARIRKEDGPGKGHWVLDYSRSRLFPVRIVHDEVRMLDDNTALGKVFIRVGSWKRFIGGHFLLQFNQSR